MSLLNEIKVALKGNHSISFIIQVGSYSTDKPHSGYSYHHFVRVFVAPKFGGYDLQSLQELVAELTPGIKVDSMENFKRVNFRVDFAKLCFSEDIGAEVCQRDITFTDEEARKVLGKKVRFKHTLTLKRCIIVYVFPSKKIRKAVMFDDAQEYMSMEDFLKHRSAELDRRK